MSRNQQDPPRLVESPYGALEEKAAQHVRENLTPLSFSPAQIREVERRLERAKENRTRMLSLLLPAGAAFAVAVAAFGVVGLWRLSAANHAQAALANRASVQSPTDPMAKASAEANTQRLDDGSIDSSTENDPVSIVTPDARVTIAKRSTAKTSVRSMHTEVAVYSGSGKITFVALNRTLDIGAGQKADQSGVSPIAQSHSEVTKVGSRTRPESTLGAESRFLQRALKKLREESDARGALRELAMYRAQFPAGELAVEADRISVDALLKADRKHDALVILDRLPLTDGIQNVAMTVLRGELRAEARRYGDARSDFSWANPKVSGSLAERALFGHAQASAKLGDEVTARADLSQYLTRFPEGRFASAAKSAISNGH